MKTHGHGTLSDQRQGMTGETLESIECLKSDMLHSGGEGLTLV